MRHHHIVLAVLSLLAAIPARATPLSFDLGAFAPPAAPDIGDHPRDCTVTYLVEDDAANLTYAERMVFTPAPGGPPAQNGVMPCPALVPARVAQAALDNCQEHAAHKGDCVFADMSRGFQDAPGISNTAANASSCGSDHASRIAIACWRSGKLDVCNVGCGTSDQDAIAAARNRCQIKHQQACTITGALPVAAP